MVGLFADFALTRNPSKSMQCRELCYTSATNISQDGSLEANGARCLHFIGALRPSTSLLPSIFRRLTRNSQRDSSCATVSMCVLDRTSPGTNFEDWRFENGWKLGDSDRVRLLWREREGFVFAGGDKIGCLENMVLKG